MELWLAIVLIIVGVIGGLVGGFFTARWYFKKQLRENPPINEKMIRAMFKSMGRPCSEKQVREIMKNVNNQVK